MAVIAALVICVVAYTVGKHSGCKEGKTVLVTDTLVMDVTHYDTIYRDNIAYKWRTVKDTVYVRGVGGDSTDYGKPGTAVFVTAPTGFSLIVR